jgi:hypothetical protein
MHRGIVRDGETLQSSKAAFGTTPISFRPGNLPIFALEFGNAHNALNLKCPARPTGFSVPNLKPIVDCGTAAIFAQPF